MLTIEEVKKLGELARIELSESDLIKFQKELSQILNYVEDLKQVNTEGLEIVSQVTGLENVLRIDEHEELATPKSLLGQVPTTSQGYVKVKSLF
jgi:aspartyl-tRNA(Asn)/glutamyl-tRNA(Gln) amidotransferase subunit C